MSWLVVKCALLLLSVAFSLCDGQVCTQDDVTLTANQCTEPDELFNSTVSVVPGSSISFTCSLEGTNVNWNSSQFAALVVVDSANMAAMDSGIAFQFGGVTTNPTCASATATITNIQESMDGLDLTCVNIVPALAFNRTVIVDIIDPPGAVMSVTAEQYSNTITTSWMGPSSGICPVTGYNVSISDVSDGVIHVPADQTSYTYSINGDTSSSDNVCGKTLDINVSAINAAGASNVNSTNITIDCTPTNVFVVSIGDESAVIQWTHTDVPGVVGYEVMSMSGGMSSVTSPVNMASVGVNDYTQSVTFTVTSLTAGNEPCFTAQTSLPAMKSSSNVAPAPEGGIITFRFQVQVMELTNVSWSPDDGECFGELSGTMDVDVTCSDFVNNVDYTVTISGILVVNGPLPFNFSELLTPTASSPTPSDSLFTFRVITNSSMPTPTSTATSTPTESTAQSSGLGRGVIIALVVVGLVAVILVIVVLCLVLIIKYVKSRTRKVHLGHEQEDGDGAPIALVEKKDPKTGEVGTYDNSQEKEVLHKEAPTGDEYAVVEKPATRRAAPSTPQFEAMTYQDPSTIQRQEAPTGDLYALPNKESKEPKESMPVYSEVNKQPDRVYADLALSKGGDSGVNRQQPTQEGFVTYSEILPPGVPPARPPKPQESIPETSLYSEIQQPPPPPSPLAEQDSMVDVPEEESLYEKHQSN